MKPRHSKYFRVLGIAPSSRGFGFAVVEPGDKLVDWGVKSIKENKNQNCLTKVKELITHYRPNAIVLEEYQRRSPRIIALRGDIIAQGKSNKIKVSSRSRETLRKVFLQNDKGTKYDRALILASRFPNELGQRLPPKRQPWMSQDYRMDIFDAVALAISCK